MYRETVVCQNSYNPLVIYRVFSSCSKIEFSSVLHKNSQICRIEISREEKLSKENRND